MNSKVLRLLAIVTFVLLSADAFADGRHSGRGRSSHGARYSNSSSRIHVSYVRPRPYVVGAYIPAYAPVYPDYYAYDDYRYGDPYDRYVSYPRYRTYVTYRPYPVYRYRPSLVITARFGGRR